MIQTGILLWGALPGAQYMQTSLWAKVKALLGWRVIRLVLSCQGHIVAGAQLLVRSIPLFGEIGCVARGPLFASNDPALNKAMLVELYRMSKAQKIRYLTVQPPGTDENFARELLRWGFRPGSLLLRPAYSATVLIDLTKDLDAILAKMKAKMRYNIRLGESKYPGSREGTDRDIVSFYYLLEQTGKRQGFVPDTRELIYKMWRVLHAHGYAKLFITEYEGEPVASILTIAFGDTVTYWRGAWSGRYGNRHPNERLHWRAMQWAKAQGFHYYDLGGIDPMAAKAIINGQPLPEWVHKSVTPYKLGFGGQVVVSSEAYEYVENPIFRWGFGRVFPNLSNWTLPWKVVELFRRH